MAQANQPKSKNIKRSHLNLTPGGKTRVVRIELSLLNGRSFDHCLSTTDIISIWSGALRLKSEYLLRQASFRGPNNTFRVNFRLTEPAYLSELITNPDISYEKKTLTGVDTYTGRVLDIDNIEEAKLGEVVTVIIKRTNAELSEEQVAQWLMRFGKIISHPRYVFSIVQTGIHRSLASVNPSLIRCQLAKRISLTTASAHCVVSPRQGASWQKPSYLLLVASKHTLDPKSPLVSISVICSQNNTNLPLTQFPASSKTSRTEWRSTPVWQIFNLRTTSLKHSLPTDSGFACTIMETSNSATTATASATASSNASPKLLPGTSTLKSSKGQEYSQKKCLATGSKARPCIKDIPPKRNTTLNTPTMESPPNNRGPISKTNDSVSKGGPPNANWTASKVPTRSNTVKNLRKKQILNLTLPQSTMDPVRRRLEPDFSLACLEEEQLPKRTDFSITQKKNSPSLSTVPSDQERIKESPPTETSTSAAHQCLSERDQKILWWNCGGGLRFKIDYIKYTINTLNPYIFFISESEVLANDDVGVFSIKNYELLLSQTLGRGKARVCAYVREGIKYKRLAEIENKTVDVIGIELENYIIIGVYKPFKVLDPMVNNLENMLEALYKIETSSKRILVGGDFNVDWKKENAQKEKLTSWSAELNLIQVIQENTRLRLVNTGVNYHLEESCIDHLYVSDEAMASWASLRKAQPSDHHMIQALVPFSVPPEKKKIQIRDWRHYSKAELNMYIRVALENYSDWIENGPDTLLDRITQFLLIIYEELVPLRVAKVESQQPLSSKIEALRKRRDRFLKKFKKTENPEHAEKARSFSRTLKKTIKKEQKRTLKIKATSGNTKCFWNAVAKLQGKHHRSIGELVVNGERVSDPEKLAEAFADGFLNKITKLTTNQNGIKSVPLPEQRMEDFTMDELKLAFLKTKSKKSSGVDGLPTCVVKDSFDSLSNYYLQIFNNVLQNGMPDIWKIAVVTPLHKKGSMEDTSNYRPISNLSSLSKIFEKCVLQRLENQIDLVGENQHGFRARHSTTTAMLDVQNNLGTSMDASKFTLVYSVDMSAAFDLLRADTFHDILKDKLSQGMMRTLLDFLTDRHFTVRVTDSESTLRQLDRGCVQGSVLGPALFSLYCKDLKDKLPEAVITSYADDTYVVLSSYRLNHLLDITKSTMASHFNYLETLGMVVNKDKTEMMLMNHYKKQLFPASLITESGEEIILVKSMKILGITFDFDLSWRTHMDNLMKKSQRMISGLKIIRHALTESQFTTVATSQYFGSLYYGLPVWYDCLLKVHQQKMDVLHYKLLRIIVKDWRRIFPRDMLDTLGRAPPNAFAKYSTGNVIINTLNHGTPLRLYQTLSANLYQLRRSGQTRSFDASKKRIGKQSLRNRMDHILQSFTGDWHILVDKHEIRKFLKKTFL